METQAICPTAAMTPTAYLNRLVQLKTALHHLDDHPQIKICNNDLQVQVYQGIGELAFAAGQTLKQIPRDSRDFPLELQFVYDGVTFCQLKSAQSLAALPPV